MTIFLYFMIFITGSVFGSFFSLAVYRLPRKENITYVRSHCTTCNHKLYPIDLIPIWSYIFLGGKCRYCKDKIRSRYILLEIFSGLVFVLVALTQKITAYSSLTDFINLFFVYLFICALFIIGGIDKEKYEIHEGTILYGIIISLMYGLYRAFVFGYSMKYQLAGFIAIPIIMIFINKLVNYLGDEKKIPIGFGDIEYIALIGLFVGFGMQILTIVLSVLIATICALIKKQKQIPYGYYLSISTAILLIIEPYISYIPELLNITIL